MVVYGKCGLTPDDYRLTVVEAAGSGAVAGVRAKMQPINHIPWGNDAVSLLPTFTGAHVHVRTRVTHHALWRTDAVHQMTVLSVCTLLICIFLI